MTATIITERQGNVVIVRLNRPKVLNALNSELMAEIVAVMKPLDSDSQVRCFVITGNEKAFAAGADIGEMASKNVPEMINEDFFAGWDEFTRIRTPKIAAVGGYALGGGCELAMMCDLIFAGENARFGQPEITLGVIPGIGGSQRLCRLVGRTMAMDMILTGRMLSAREALSAGLVSRVFPVDQLESQTIEVAKTIAGYPKIAVMLAKEVVDQGEQMSLDNGLRFERRVFHSLFATNDQSEGMCAFLEKRPPRFTGN